MDNMMFFDNDDDDGQISMFDMSESVEEYVAANSKAAKGKAEPQEKTERTVNVRINNCSCCGRMLFVREESDAYTSNCPACGVKYLQKK